MIDLSTEKHAPIALFAFNRIDHLRQTVAALKTNLEAKSSHLYIYCDGPKIKEHAFAVQKVRDFVNQIDGFASIDRHYQESNIGLAKSIIAGVSEVVARHGCVIVVEDDLVVSPYFLAYMNKGLRLYKDEPTVASIHGYSYPITETLPETFFLRGADCWGWATWSRAWKCFEPDGKKLLTALRQRKLFHAFDMNGAYPYTRMLTNQIKGKNNSWAVRWHASCFLANMLTLYPGKSLVNNIGMDGNGTHCTTTDEFAQVISTDPVNVEWQKPVENVEATILFSKFLRRQTSFFSRVRRTIERAWKK